MRITFCVEGVNLEILIDPGAKSNVMVEYVWERLKTENIKCYSYVRKKILSDQLGHSVFSSLKAMVNHCSGRKQL